MYDPRLRPGFGGKESFRLFSCIMSSTLGSNISLILDFPRISRILIWISCILIKCLPPYTVEPRYFEVPREMEKKFEIAGL